MLSSDIAVDFGTSTIRIYLAGKGIVISEPSVMAINSDTSVIVAIGKNAYQMVGRTAPHIVIEHPFIGGVVASYSMAEHIVSSYIKRIGMGKLFLPGAIVSVPEGSTEVEKHAICDIIERSGIRKIHFIEETVAAAMGAGLNVKASIGSMIVDVGEVKTSLAVISGNQVIASNRISLAGRNFNEAIIRYLRKKHHLEIGPSTAEAVKCEIGSVFPREKVISCHVKGRSLVSGLPDEIILTSDEMVEALIDPTLQIAKAVEACLEFIPPEILSDIARSGITLVGGSARIFGFDKFIEKRVKLPTAVIENPEEAVINGAGKALGLLAKAENPRSFVGALSFKK